MKHLCCKDILGRLVLTTLCVRRVGVDLIGTYKMLSEKENIKREQFLELSNNGYFLWGHTMKLAVSRQRLDIRKYSFSQRVVADSNRLPEHAEPARQTLADFFIINVYF